MQVKHVALAISVGMLLTACATGSGSSSASIAVDAPKPAYSGNLYEDLELKSDLEGVFSTFSKQDAWVKDLRVKIGDKTFDNGSKINFKELGQGFVVMPVTASMQVTVDHEDKAQMKSGEKIVSGNMALLQQQYSLAFVGLHNKITHADGTQTAAKIDLFGSVHGKETKNLPAGQATYVGKGYSIFNNKFDSKNDVDTYNFTYNVDFANKTGEGSLVGRDTLTLQKGNLTFNLEDEEHQIEGKITGLSNGEYKLNFFGDNAEEIAGSFDSDSKTGIIGGKKQ